MSDIEKVGSEFLVNTQTAGDQSLQAITALSNGNFVVTWQDFSGTLGDSSSTSIMAQIFAPDGTKVGSQFLVNTQTINAQTTPEITSLTNGGFVITWLDYYSGPTMAQLFAADGTKIGYAFVPAFTSSLAITDLSNGDLVVTWADKTNLGANVINVQMFAADGTKVGSQLEVSPQTAGTQRNLTVTALANGGFVVSWEDFNGTLGDSSGSSIKAQILDANGAKVGSEFLVNTQTVNYQFVPAITALANGGFVVTWEDSSALGEDSSGYSIKAQIFGANGAKVGSEFLVNTQTTGSQFYPTTATLNDGSFVIAWIDQSGTLGDSAGESIMAQVFASDGTKIGSQFLVNTQTINNQTVQSITALGNNGFVITWTDYSGTLGDTSGASIKAQIFEVNSSVPTPTQTIISSGIENVDTITMDFLVEGSGVLNLNRGGSASHEIIVGNGGNFYDYGTTTDVTIQSGGAMHVYHGGSAANTIVEAGGFQNVWDASTVTGTDLSGNQQVLAGGVAIGTQIAASGRAFVGAGGSASGSVISAGGMQYVDAGATASATDIEGGFLFAGGTAIGTTINGGEMDVAGMASDTALVSGVEHVFAGGVQNGVDFGGGGAGILYLEDVSGFNGTIANFEIGDLIDLRDLSSITSATLSPRGADDNDATLTLGTSNGDITWQFTDMQADSTFNITDDGQGGWAISLTPMAQYSAASLGLFLRPAAATSTIVGDNFSDPSFSLLTQYSASFGGSSAPAATIGTAPDLQSTDGLITIAGGAIITDGTPMPTGQITIVPASLTNIAPVLMT